MSINWMLKKIGFNPSKLFKLFNIKPNNNWEFQHRVVCAQTKVGKNKDVFVRLSLNDHNHMRKRQLHVEYVKKELLIIFNTSGQYITKLEYGHEHISSLFPDSFDDYYEKYFDITCDICSICRDEIMKNSLTISIPCKHNFHIRCITKWIRTGKKTCPVCRCTIIKKSIVDANAVDGDPDDLFSDDENNNENNDSEDDRGTWMRVINTEQINYSVHIGSGVNSFNTYAC